MTTRAKTLSFIALCALSIALTTVALAAAPAGRYTVRAQTVIDNRTGLIWQRDYWNLAVTQASARGYCDDLDLAGSNNWTLPTIEELISIVDPTVHQPALDPAFTQGTIETTAEQFEFWSTSAVQGDPSNATNCWAVNFAFGHTYRPLISGMQDVTPQYTRCVLRPQ